MTKTKKAYLVRDRYASRNINSKLYTRSAVRKAVKAAKRVGFSRAEAVSINVSRDCVLKGEPGWCCLPHLSPLRD